MSDPEGEGLPDLEQLLVDRFFLGLIDQLQAQFRNVGSGRVEDAVAHAVEKVLKRLEKGQIRDVKAYLAKVAYNDLNKFSRRQKRYPEVVLDERDEGASGSAEDSALRSAAIDIIKAEVRSWENANIREVMLVYIDVIAYDEPMDTDEVAELVSATLGQEIAPGSVRTWKARGLRKLREFIEGVDGFDAPNRPKEDEK